MDRSGGATPVEDKFIEKEKKKKEKENRNSMKRSEPSLMKLKFESTLEILYIVII